MGQLRTANKRHNRAVSAAVAARRDALDAALPPSPERVEAVS